MSGGAEHLAAYKKGWKDLPIFTLLVWISTAFYYWEHIDYVLEVLKLSCILYVLGLGIDPDLDQPGVSSADSRLSKIPILGIPLFLWWTLYALLMGALSKLLGGKSNLDSHRKWFTHSYFGTAIRVVWFYIPFLPLLRYIPEYITVGMMYQIVLATFLALCVSDRRHYKLDGLRTI